MPNPWGTALQVLAGAFGEGASSLGQSRVDQSILDDKNRREDSRMRVLDDRWNKEYGLQERELAGQEADRASRLDIQQQELDVLGGLTPNQYRQVQALMEANPGMSYRTARLKVLTNDSDVRGTPIANPRPDGGSPVRATPPVSTPQNPLFGPGSAMGQVRGNFGLPTYPQVQPPPVDSTPRLRGRGSRPPG